MWKNNLARNEDQLKKRDKDESRTKTTDVKNQLLGTKKQKNHQHDA